MHYAFAQFDLSSCSANIRYRLIGGEREGRKGGRKEGGEKEKKGERGRKDGGDGEGRFTSLGEREGRSRQAGKKACPEEIGRGEGEGGGEEENSIFWYRASRLY